MTQEDAEARLKVYHSSLVDENFDPKRRLEPSEWEEIQAIIREHGFPRTLKSSGFGFRIAMHVYKAPPPPTYPGVNPDPAVGILAVDHDNLPLTCSADGQRVTLREAYRTFKCLVLTPENTKMLDECNLNLVRPFGYYTY